MSAQNADFAAQLARAWAYHRQGNNASAITEFEAILASSKDNVDALYGLGLAQRSNGRTDKALEAFRRADQLIAVGLQEKPNEDRYEMLERMIKQRLAEIEGTPIR